MSRVKILLWKELRELSRDKKALLTTILLPLLSLPAIGVLVVFLTAQQPVYIAIVDEDQSTYTSPLLNITVNSSSLAGMLADHLERQGYTVYNYTNRNSALENPAIDLIIVIPRGFSENASSVDRVASVEILRRANVQASQQAESVASGIISYYSAQLSYAKLESLARLANLSYIEPEAFRNPVVVGRVVLVTPSGAPAGMEEVFKGFIARLLVLGFSFAVTPAVSYVIDGIIGERERKTIEMLLASPALVSEIFSSKLLAASVIGSIASIADLGGVLAWFTSMVIAYGGSMLIAVDPVLIGLHVATTFLTILVTVAIATPFIARVRGLRTASNIAGIASSIGLVFFIAGWIIDFPKLPPSILYPLMLIPYTHSILVIQSYIYGEPGRAVLSMVILLLVSLISIAVSLKFMDREKLLLARY
ncbi:MAG: ABC transporter permease [Desulfurococcus sp.]|nr:ABC transporter permease [Desulfurococcus sp.]